jgi:acetyl-CoA decarbonylase/synthase complex subunit gamma
LRFADWLGTVKARLGIGRMHYDVPPGLYAVGSPSAGSPVFVSANYKMSFDHLRRALAGREGWILVLDTQGINVWCAAGKGTFGTDEIVRSIEATRLAEIVSHRVLLLPQLSAPGVAAHEVRKRSGFRVVYGPVRARDLPAFLDTGNKATPEMRRVTFNFLERLVLTPVEVVNLPRPFLLALAALFFLAGLGRHGYSFREAIDHGVTAVSLLSLAFLGGAVVTPALLPWLPGRAFAMKGATVGLSLGIACAWWRWMNAATAWIDWEGLAWLFLLPAVSAFFAMNFTGASTYTSLSGVRKEMRFAVPAQIAGASVGLCLWLMGRWV